MSDTESLDYLQTGFDPSTLTVPRLRSILVSHNIQYPASAKKPQLIEIFTENVLPQSKKILATRARARRTSKGITNAERVEDVAADEELMPPPPTPKPRSSRTPSSKVKVEDSESETSAPRSPTKKTPRVSSKNPRPSDTETGTDADGKKSVRKSRKSQAIPELKKEEIEVDVATRSGGDSVFSYDNPFQSGSSPPPIGRSPSTENRRKTTGTTKDSERRKSPATRRRTDGPRTKDDGSPQTSKTFEIPVSKLNGLKTEDDNGVEAGEEFTPEAQMELVRERSANGINAVVPRRPKKKASRGISMAGPLWVILLTLLSGYAVWYRQEKLKVGYCGVGRGPNQMIADRIELISDKVQIPDWAIALADPPCEPCPKHAYCYERLETTCEPDFVLKPHPLSLGGVIPLPPTCEPDGEKVRRVKVVADRAVEELRDRRAKWECGELVDETGAPATSVEIDAEDLKKEVSKKRRKGMSETEFEDLWVAAIGEIVARDEVETKNDGNSVYGSLCSTSLAKISLSCAIRRSFRLAVARYRFEIGFVGLLILLALYVRQKYISYMADKVAVPHLITLTLSRLADQAALHASDKEAFPERWISINQLRDDVLREEHSVSRRQALWSKVRNVVEMNANVRSSQREDRNGEVSRVWEWIGAVGSIEDGESRRRKSGRVSWGAYGETSSPVSGTDGGPEMVQQKWEEGRPIY